MDTKELREQIQGLVYAELDNALAYTNGGAPSRQRTEELEADLATAKAELDASLLSLLEDLDRTSSSNEAMRKALEPFAAEADLWDDESSNDTTLGSEGDFRTPIFRLGDLRRAREALSSHQGKEQ